MSLPLYRLKSQGEQIKKLLLVLLLWMPLAISNSLHARAEYIKPPNNFLVIPKGDKMPPSEERLPKPKSVWESGPNSKLRLGTFIAMGTFSAVYDLADEPDKWVVKILRDYRLLRQHGENPFRTIQEIADGQKLLIDIGVETLETQFFMDTQAVTRPYIKQEKLNEKTKYRFTSRTATDSSRFTLEHQEAVVKLFRKLADHGLIWEDCKIENIFFVAKDNKIVAGIFDTDRVIRFENIQSRWHKQRLAVEAPRVGTLEDKLSNIDSLKGSDRPNDTPHQFQAGKLFFPNAEFFMIKMFEHQRWIAYKTHHVPPQFIRIKIEPWLVEDYFPGLREYVNYDFRKGRPLPPHQRPAVVIPKPVRPLRGSSLP